MAAGPLGWEWALGVVGTGLGPREIRHGSSTACGGQGASWARPEEHVAGALTLSCVPPVSHPGIDKLTEKSQVSEDGTLRSLEPEPQQSLAEGSPAKGVGKGAAGTREAGGAGCCLPPWPLWHGLGQGTLGSPATSVTPRALGLALLVGCGGLPRPLPCLLVTVKPCCQPSHPSALSAAGLYPSCPNSPWS